MLGSAVSSEKERTYDANRSLKQRLVDEGRAHAALVYDGDEAVAWAAAEYGSPATMSLPSHLSPPAYDEQADLLPDYRITCTLVDKRYRRRGLSAVALQGALDLIGAAGGGVVEGYPHDTGGKKMSVLYDESARVFEPRASRTCAPRAWATASCAVPSPDLPPSRPATDGVR